MSAIAPFPHRYAVALADKQLQAPPRVAIPAGAPPQFGGSDGVWSPEELLVGSALLCLSTTFDAFARREALVVRNWRGSATGLLDKGPTGPTFTAVDLRVDILVSPGDEERCRRLVETAEKHCIVSHALRCPVRVEATVRAA
jgi:organic hydroperoxide reductase OsmC/OhrA